MVLFIYGILCVTVISIIFAYIEWIYRFNKAYGSFLLYMFTDENPSSISFTTRLFTVICITILIILSAIYIAS